MKNIVIIVLLALLSYGCNPSQQKKIQVPQLRSFEVVEPFEVVEQYSPYKYMTAPKTSSRIYISWRVGQGDQFDIVTVQLQFHKEDFWEAGKVTKLQIEQLLDERVHVDVGARWVDWWWYDNFSTSRLKPKCKFIVMGAIGWPAGEDPQGVLESVQKLRSLGLDASPGFSHIIQDNDTTGIHQGLADWFKTETWQAAADFAAEIHALLPNEEQLFIDIEPYFSGGRRYPTADEYDILETAMMPFIDFLKTMNWQILSMPGREYVGNKILDQHFSGFVGLMERTYRAPMDDVVFDTIEPLVARNATEMEAWPGFYQEALRTPEFSSRVREFYDGEFWIWFQRGNKVPGDYWKFGLMEWWVK